ncbi:hypothetical protein GCM10027570_15740 [Streptomonospora sediminis]
MPAPPRQRPYVKLVPFHRDELAPPLLMSDHAPAARRADEIAPADRPAARPTDTPEPWPPSPAPAPAPAPARPCPCPACPGTCAESGSRAGATHRATTRADARAGLRDHPRPRTSATSDDEDRTAAREEGLFHCTIGAVVAIAILCHFAYLHALIG